MLTLHTTYIHHQTTARSMAELRPLVEMAFQLLDHFCSDRFKLGAQVCTSMTDPHTHQPNEPHNVTLSNKPNETKTKAAAESRAVRREIEAREARFQEALRREEAERRRQEREREACVGFLVSVG